MRYCEKCGLVMDEFCYWRDKQNCPICSGVWSEDDMTAVRYAELSEAEKDAYDEQLLSRITSSPYFDICAFRNNGNSTENGKFWAGFRVDKWRRLDKSVPLERIDETIEDRKTREPFKPFSPIDMVKARKVAIDAEIAREEMESRYLSQRMENVPKCPTCSSTNIQRISALSKIFDNAIYGFFGTKRYKTFHCNNCGYEW